jgi:hypothetical protein
MAKDGFSMNTEVVRSRLRRLPKLIDDHMDAFSKRDAEDFIKNFRAGLRNNAFRLEPLRPETMRCKKRQGYSRPASPLYGLGLEGTRTYTSSVHIYKIKQGWRVNVLDVKHHEADVSVKTLFHIHEHGVVINTGKAVIRIPARPAFRRAYEQTLAQHRDKEASAAVLEAITAAMNGRGTDSKRGRGK